MVTTVQTCDSIIDALKWRYATKKFDPTRKVPADVWKTLESALLLSPSSFGMQPYKFVIVTDKAIKEQLVPFSYSQNQPAECSHLVVFCRLDPLNIKHADHYIKRVSEVRGVPEGSLAEYKGMMTAFIERMPAEKLADWTAMQCYIALGNFMTVAATMQVDTCPMEGFLKEDYDRVLGLAERGLRSVVVCAVGYRAADDKYALAPKVRFPESDLIVNI